MQGVSTKVTAAAVAGWFTAILLWVLTSASFGPGWESPPAEVVAAVVGLLTIVVGYLVPEGATSGEGE